jgi:hypothetical protein
MAGRPITASSDGAGNDEIGLGHPHWQVGKERPDLGIDAKAPVGVAHSFFVLRARLLNDDQLLPGGFGHEFDRGGHDVRKNRGALRTSGNKDPQLPGGTLWKGHARGLDHHRTNRVSCRMRLCRQSPGEAA